MKGDRKQYRVVATVEWPFDDGSYTVTKRGKRTYNSRAAAERNLLRYGPEPWLAYGKGPDDDWCHGLHRCDETQGSSREGYREFKCPHVHTTARDFFEGMRRKNPAKVLDAHIEERTVSPWSRVTEEATS